MFNNKFNDSREARAIKQAIITGNEKKNERELNLISALSF